MAEENTPRALVLYRWAKPEHQAKRLAKITEWLERYPVTPAEAEAIRALLPRRRPDGGRAGG